MSITGGNQAAAPIILRASDLMHKSIPRISFIIPSLIPEGITLLIGRPKIGKSWLLLNAALAVAEGGTVLGNKVEKATALYLALEDNERRLKSRLNSMLAGRPGPEGLELATSWPRLDQGGCEELDRWCQTANNP